MNHVPTGLHVRGLATDVGGFGLGPLDLDVAAGEILAVVGPSGCGKSTLLNALAGFVQGRGHVGVGASDISTLPPERRPVGLVFQHPVLFHGMTVRENIGYGLDDTRMLEGKRSDLIDIAMANLRIGSLADAEPGTLSGGQSQRVALAQTLVRKPRVLLLDEPLSHVEASLRRDIRRDIRRQVSRDQVAAVYVTHDQEDAFLVADRVAVMRQGKIVQVDWPMRVYRRPASRFVADLMGQENVLSGMVLGSAGQHLARVRIGNQEYRIPCGDEPRLGPATVVLPPESVELTGVDPAAEVVGDVGQVITSAFLGHRSQTEVETDLGTLVVHEWDAEVPRAVGQMVRFTVRAGRGWVMQG
ncbi:MAG: ABC transporter ATP-binding protein [Galactobacter sp.]